MVKFICYWVIDSLGKYWDEDFRKHGNIKVGFLRVLGQFKNLIILGGINGIYDNIEILRKNIYTT